MRKTLRRPQFWFGLLVLIPVLVWYLVFSFRPVFMSFRVALVDYQLLDPSNSPWVGISNFQTLFSTYELFWKVVRNTLSYALLINISVPPLSLLCAVCLVALGKRARSVYQGILFLPVVVSMAAMALIFKMMMCPSGILNHLLELIGLPPYRWLSSPDTALTSVALLSIWKSLGGNIVILTAGLLAIPNEIYDAAKVDGAGGWKLFRRVTLPLLTPSLKLVVTLTIIGSLQAYTSAVVLTNGGPVNSTLMISQFITSEAFDNMRFGVASASAFLLFLVIFSVTMVQLRIMKTKWEY